MLAGGDTKTRHVLIFLLSSAALVLQACNAAGQSQETIVAVAYTAIAQTEQVSQLETAAAAAGQATPTSTPTPALPTDTPSATPTPTSSIPYVSVSVDTFCRSGPRINYKALALIQAGLKVEVIAVFPGSEYVLIKNGLGDCWLWLRYANVTDFSAYNLPVATQPPTPIPTRTPVPTETPDLTPEGV